MVFRTFNLRLSLILRMIFKTQMRNIVPRATANPTEPRSNLRLKVVWITAGVITLIFVYFLTFGPVMKLLDRGKISKNQVATVYLPVLILADKSQVFNKVLDWYVTDVWHVGP
jgi:hypothetical protein